MPRHLIIKPYLNEAELRKRFRMASDLVTRNHWQIIWLVAKGHTTAQISEITGNSANWVRRIVGRYNQEGPEGLGDRRQHNQGGSAILSDELQAELKTLLLSPAPAGANWTNRQVIDWIEAKTGQRLYPQLVWAYRNRLMGNL